MSWLMLTQCPAAQHLRMFTDQQVSPLNQAAAIASYAERRNSQSSKTHEDVGRSGPVFVPTIGPQALLKMSLPPEFPTKRSVVLHRGWMQVFIRACGRPICQAIYYLLVNGRDPLALKVVERKSSVRKTIWCS